MTPLDYLIAYLLIGFIFSFVSQFSQSEHTVEDLFYFGLGVVLWPLVAYSAIRSVVNWVRLS